MLLEGGESRPLSCRPTAALRFVGSWSSQSQLIVLLAGGVALAFWLSRRLGESGAETARVLDELLAVRNREVDGRLEAITATMDRRLGELDTKVDRRMEHAAKQTNAIHKQLGEVGQATVQMAEQAKGLSELQEILRPPKARGGFGELLLENLLRDRLPATAFEFQYGFAGGERVDAVIKVDRIVPIDSKFPLDNFERMLRADNDIERQQFEKLFARDVKSHVDAISSEVHPARRGHLRLRLHVPAVGGDLLRARLRHAPARCSRTRTRSGCCPSRRPR